MRERRIGKGWRRVQRAITAFGTLNETRGRILDMRGSQVERVEGEWGSSWRSEWRSFENSNLKAIVQQSSAMIVPL
jgi:hypothetical protein